MKPFENVDDQLNHFLNPQAMDPTHNLNFKERTRSSLEFILFLWNWRSIIQNQTSAAKAEGQIVLTFSFGRPLHSYFHATLFWQILVFLGTSSIVVDILCIAANQNVKNCHMCLFWQILVLLGTCTSSIVLDKLRIAANSNVKYCQTCFAFCKLKLAFQYGPSNKVSISDFTIYLYYMTMGLR